MHVEVSVALNFVISYLYNKLPRRRVDMFGEELEKGLKMKFDGHWYPDKPFKGSAFRCIRVTGEGMDPVMEMAASSSGLDIEEIKDYLPADLTVWIDPLEVSYRIGEKGVVKVLYSNKEAEAVDQGLDREIQAANKGFNPDAQCFKPIDSLSSSITNLSLSPSSPSGGSPPNAPNAAPGFTQSTSPITSFLNRNTQKPLMTTAMFAQTKFGSTKLKSQAKRPSRLSPTEGTPAFSGKRHGMFQQGLPGMSMTQLSPSSANSPTSPFGQGIPAMRPRTLSPRDARDPRQDILGQQQRLYMAAQQQHQQQQQMGLGSPAMLSPMDSSPVSGGSLNDLYNSYGNALLYSDLLSGQNQGQQSSPRGSIQQSTPSPDANRTLLDGINMNALPPYANIQHMLVAN